VSNDFYRAYYLGLLQDVFSVLTDTLHKPGFKLHSQILATLFLTVDSDAISCPLWPAETQVAAGTTNQQYLRELRTFSEPSWSLLGTFADPRCGMLAGTGST